MNQQFELFDIDNPCIGVCQSNKKAIALVACAVEPSANDGMI
ncbi:hypothetical protein [Psychrobacter sp. KH172YL61]|nr:hypothetical protein [Psychrobacter sp. KH172YL61]